MDFRPKTKTINLMLLDGGVGDHVASLVAVDYVIKNYPWITPLIWCPDYMVDFAKHLLNNAAQVMGYSDMRFRYDPNKPTKTTKWDGHTSPMKIPLVDYAFLKLCDENPSIEHKNYLQCRTDEIDISKFELPEAYVIITTGFTAEVREFPAESINRIIEFLLENNVTPVFLGSASTSTGSSHVIKGTFKKEINFDKGIDLINKTSLLETAKIMSKAKAVIGVDNGLLHVAATTQVPIIGGFTTVSPECRLPVRNNILGWNYYTVVPEDSLGCRFCQQTTNFLYGHDYRYCLYKDPQKTLSCVKQMSSDKFIEHLRKVL